MKQSMLASMIPDVQSLEDLGHLKFMIVSEAIGMISSLALRIETSASPTKIRRC